MLIYVAFLCKLHIKNLIFVKELPEYQFLARGWVFHSEQGTGLALKES